MVPTNGGLYNTESKNLIFWHLDFLNAGGITWQWLPCGNVIGPGIQKSQCSKMAMRIAAWAWFSPRARVPRGAPCIFGNILQTRVNAYAPDIPFWSQGCFQRAVLVGGQTPLGQMGILRAVPDHKMSSSSAMLPDCSGAGGACVAEYSVFCTAQAGVHQDQKEHPSLFMQSVMESMQNTKRRHC